MEEGAPLDPSSGGTPTAMKHWQMENTYRNTGQVVAELKVVTSCEDAPEGSDDDM
mgnify:CR=1 FL=1